MTKVFTNELIFNFTKLNSKLEEKDEEINILKKDIYEIQLKYDNLKIKFDRVRKLFDN